MNYDKNNTRSGRHLQARIYTLAYTSELAKSRADGMVSRVPANQIMRDINRRQKTIPVDRAQSFRVATKPCRSPRA